MQKSIKLLLLSFVMLLQGYIIEAQNVDFTLRYNETTSLYEVYARPDFTDPTYFVGGGSQLSILVPAVVNDQALQVTTVAGGFWSDNSQTYAPTADPLHDFHGVASNGSILSFVAGEELLLFTFTTAGNTCISGVRLFENGSDPDSNAPGMGGGDFENYFTNFQNPSVNAWQSNYDNQGTTCPAAPLVLPNAITIQMDSTGNLCMPIIDQNAGDTFTASICSGAPNNGTATPTINGNEVCLEYIPTTGFFGTDGVCLVVCDQTNLCDTVQIPVTVIEPVIPVDTTVAPIVIPNPLTTTQDSIASVCMPILDPNIGDVFTASLCTDSPVNGTAGISITGNTLCLLYIPNNGFTGSDPVCLIVCDQTNLCDTISVPVTVVPTPGGGDVTEPPVVVFPVIVTDEDVAVTTCASIIDVNVDDTFTATICEQPDNGFVIPTINDTTDQLCLIYIPNPDYSGVETVCVIVCDQTDLCDTFNVPIIVLDVPDIVYTEMSVKVMLYGAMLGATDGMMRADMTLQNHVPLAQPYSSAMSSRFTHHGLGGSEMTTAAVLSADAGTPNAIVDWVFLEARDPLDHDLILETLSGLVQRDGDIVGADGEALLFPNLPDSIYLSVKHRNHMGTMTGNPVIITNGVVAVDFTTAADADLWSTPGFEDKAMTTHADSGLRALWAGNANGDGKVKYDGTANDRVIVSADVITHPENTGANLNFADAEGYFLGDVNMDGKVKYDGSNNDRLFIQNFILLYPTNTNFLNNFNNMLEQVPQ